MKPLFVGQAPARRGNPAAPLEGRVGQRLADLMGIEFAEYLDVTDRTNLLPKFPGRRRETGAKRGGDHFPLKKAKWHARRLKIEDRIVVLLGKGVARAFELDVDFLTVHEHRGATVAIIPHPSGKNLWWNDPANVAAATDFLRGFLDGQG